MKLLVDGPSLARVPGRLAEALAGLGRRGHDVAWLGGDAPAADGVRPIAGLRDLAGERPGLVVGTGAPRQAALLARRTRARALIVDLGESPTWDLLDRIALGGLPRYGLLAPAAAETARARLPGDVLPQVALWPDAAEGAPGAAEHPDVAFLERAGERLLARSSGPRSWPALFLDRDGTLIVERGYLADPDGVQLLPGVAAALREVQAAGVALVVISNQAGVGRGRFPLATAWATMARMRRLLRAERVELDAVRFCPHAPEEGCACRKPGTRLLEEAAADLNLALASSAMAGDRWLDAAAGRAAGGTGILVRTGYGREEEARIAAGDSPAPDLVMDDLGAVAAWVVWRMDAR